MTLPRPPLIVALGASAGGIPAMEGFFRHLPPGDAMAFVIVTHLSPDRESLLHQVIGQQTELPVHVAEDAQEVQGGHIYVMPENATMSIRSGRLHLHALDAFHRERKPVDVFFAALAEDQGENAVGIVLSGGDSDGTLGVKVIKEHGGFTLAQGHDGSGPRNPEMPDSAIASGLIDFALPVEEMGAKLEDLLDGRAALGGIIEGRPDDQHLRQAQDEIAQLLRTHSGHDFSGYKGKTFMRRVARRMQVRQSQTIEGYLERLREEPAEVMALFRDLLISVTNFFRDADAFRALEELVIPRLFDGVGADGSVRVWVPGCATGEEVYSLGILLRERMERLAAPPRLQIFATDIDEPALEVARAGSYPEQLLRGVSAARREAFFTREGGAWVVKKKLRDVCVFSPHNVVSDPPFSRMDLVSCRNLLIYLGRQLQDQVLPTFHYALKPGGYLFLGTSENISQHSDIFVAIDKRQRIFQSRGHETRPRRLPTSLGGALRGVRGFDDGTRAGAASAHQLRQRVETQILDHHAPAHVVVREEGDIVYYSARTGRFLEAPRGVPNRQIFDLIRRELRLDLRAAFRQVKETGRPAERLCLLPDREGDRLVALAIEKLNGASDGEPLYLVVLDDHGAAPGAEAGAPGPAPDAAPAELELRDMRDRLQSTVEEYETALEELKSSNEELVSVNEEVQSTNEELEASKEEMQSLNEELTTINLELNAKVEELDQANVDLKNLYDATRIATVFLDSDLVIRNFTPAASTFFNLRSTDVGRPLAELSSALDYPTLTDDLREVLATGELVEHRVTPNGDGEHYLVRLVPYRDREETVAGVVLTLVDITQLGRAEEHHKVLIAELNHRVRNMLAVVVSIVKATLRSTGSTGGFAEAIVGRLHGMARAYTLLSSENWSKVAIAHVVETELAAHGPGQITVEGPEVALEPRQALALGMILHELATNAAKYGALSAAGGTVAVTWSLEDGEVAVGWRERHPRPVDASPPETTGFGFVLIRGQAEQQLGGTFETRFTSEGFEADLRFPLA